jgi:hypothetical protein
MAKRKPGRKSSLFPRVSNVRPFPRIPSNINFSDDKVVQPLVGARPTWPDSTHLRRELDDDIRGIVAWYISERNDDRRNRVTSQELLGALAKIERTVGSLIRLFPTCPSSINFDGDATVKQLVASDEVTGVADAVDRVLADSLNCEFSKLEIDGVPDLEFVCTGLEVLREAAKRVRIDEGGGGAPADRIALTLVRGIAEIFREQTGKHPSSNSNGRFFHFVVAINELIPEEFQLTGLDHLIAAAAHFTA